MSIPNWVPQSPKWFNLEAIKENNKDDFSNIYFKIAHFKYVYSKNQTYIIREAENRQAAPFPSFNAMKLLPIWIPNPATLAQFRSLLQRGLL